MTKIKLDPEGYRLTYICGIAGVWEAGGICFDNPTNEILNIASLFSTEVLDVLEE